MSYRAVRKHPRTKDEIVATARIRRERAADLYLENGATQASVAKSLGVSKTVAGTLIRQGLMLIHAPK